MERDDLPGTPVNAKLKCPCCGWDFALGLRHMGDASDLDASEEAVTTCSKCITNLVFNMDGSRVRVLDDEELAKMPAEVQHAAALGKFLALLAEEMARQKGPLQ